MRAPADAETATRLTFGFATASPSQQRTSGAPLQGAPDERKARASAVEEPVMTVEFRFGAIETIERHRIHGWARDPGRPDERLRLVILLDREIAGFAIADAFRADLRDRGIGDGGHAFRCELPPMKLRAASLVTVIAERNGSYMLIHEHAIRAAPAMIDDRSPAQRDRITVHFDISDLLVFLSGHREVSGIQRVQCGYLSNALNGASGGFEISVCAQLPCGSRYVALESKRANAILDGIETKRSMSMAEWQAFIAAEQLGIGRPPNFRPGDVILTMGAPWVHDDYYDAIEAAKAAHGVRYFQIFYDLIPTLMPEFVSIGLIGGFTKSIAGMLNCADHVLATSRYSMSDLTTTCQEIGAPCPPISVIPLGGTIDYRRSALLPASIRSSDKPSPRELHGDYVLCVGTIEPRKNHVYLYNVWKRMLRAFGPNIPKIVCIGRMGWHVEDLKRYLEVSGNLDEHFVLLPEISDADLKRHYRDCLFTVFPSLYEGWGLPIAESLFHRKLCVSSSATSMPEVGGDWVVYIDPHNVNDGFEVISSLIRNPARVKAWERRLRAQYVPLNWRDATLSLMQTIDAAIKALPASPADARTPPQASRHNRIDEGAAYLFSTAAKNCDSVRLLRAEMQAWAVRALLDGPDWHQMEDWGCWSCGAVARLRFLLSQTAEPCIVCYLTVRLPPPAVEQFCHVSVDKVSRGRIRLGGAADQQIRIDISRTAPRDCGGFPPISIELRLETISHPPRNNPDQRLLGLGLSSLCVIGTGALDKRIAFLERNALKVPDVAPARKFVDADVAKLNRRTNVRVRNVARQIPRIQNPNM